MPSVTGQNKRKNPIGESVFYPNRLPSVNRPIPADTLTTSTNNDHTDGAVFAPSLIAMVQEQARKSPRLSSGLELTAQPRRPSSSAASRKSTPRRYTPPIARPPARDSNSPGLMPAPHPSLPPVHADSVMRSRPWYMPHPDLPPADMAYSYLPFEPFAGRDDFPFPDHRRSDTETSETNANARVPTAERIGAFSTLSISSLADDASPDFIHDAIQPGQFDSPLTDAEVETPSTNAHPAIIPNSVDWSAGQIRLGRSPSKDRYRYRLSSRRDALSGSSPDPVSNPMWHASLPIIQSQHLSQVTPPQVHSSHRATSAISRRHSEGTALHPLEAHDNRVDPPASVPNAGFDGIPHIATAPRLGLFRLPLIDTSPIFAPNYTFPARQGSSQVDNHLDNALQLTIDNRAPTRPPLPTVDQPTVTYDVDPLSPPLIETYFPAYTFGSNASSAVPSLAAADSPAPSAINNETDAALTEYEIKAEALHDLHEHGHPAATFESTRFPSHDEEDLSICSAPPSTPQHGVAGSTSGPRITTEPANRPLPSWGRPVATLGSSNGGSILSTRSLSTSAGDQTICTKALNYLANNELHPDFSAKYRVKEMLGAGGYGFVCVGVTTGLGSKAGVEVAVKFLFKRRNGRERSSIPMAGNQPLESFVLQQLDHPNIISCLDVFEDDEMFYMVMELHGHAWEASDHEGRPRPLSKVSGSAAKTHDQVESDGLANPFARPDMPRRASHDLFEAVEHNRFTPAQAKDIFSQIVDAVAYMHERGVYHRDLKDENVVIDRYLRVKLIDFGSAAVEKPGGRPRQYIGDFKGTEAYAPPEVILTDQYTGEGSDIWALGILLAVVLTGDPPIKEESDKRIRPNRPRLHRKVDPLAYDLICWCMQGNPAFRADIIGVQSHQWFYVPTEDKPSSSWLSE